ncbi:ImmA/IrrE family metallo-endopeptidase [Bifidobacterium sp. AGR2158]|uniref:ImmA/IrrE family metallo-endopeptidase n=1 Tax=Bifidobacterium sp. AGR2158 TaxID=1280675 RepID=UPI00047C754F|nr:ImmA/IrrE family metallo-endopeptidase [Bifidobacterium sp. AGR2158]
MATLTVQPQVLQWAMRNADADAGAVAATNGDLAQLPNWLDSDEPLRLSFTKVSKLSKALHVPFGSLVRSMPTPQEEEPLLRYRTINNDAAEMSNDLRDVIRAMRTRQDWVRDEMISAGFEKSSIVGMAKSCKDSESLAANIRHVLSLDNRHILKKQDNDRFRYVRKQASDAGLMVMVDSMVGTSRGRLDINEFRAFVLLDDMAPLIFINRNDSYRGMMFSLLHEVGHVLLGTSELYNEPMFEASRTANERLINRAVVQALVEDDAFKQVWLGHIDSGPIAAADECAHLYGLSALTMAVHACELKLATRQDVEAVKSHTRQMLQAKESADKKRDGGNQNANTAFHLDDRYVWMVSESIKNGSLPYTDGLDLLGIRSLRAYDGLLREKGLNDV